MVACRYRRAKTRADDHHMERAMKRLRTIVGMATPLLLGAAMLTGATDSNAQGGNQGGFNNGNQGVGSASTTCQLNSVGGQIKHVVYIVFDNVHLRRDNPNVPSDLEQMPNLLNFLRGNGTISGNHRTPLISH